MDAETTRELMDSADPAVFGRRLRQARLAEGLTQTALGTGLDGGSISCGYVSRIESGQRLPTDRVAADLARRLGMSLEELVRGVRATALDEVQLKLRYAELALESGQLVEAAAQAVSVREDAHRLGIEREQRHASLVQGRALEAQGDLAGAIRQLEPLIQPSVGWDVRVRASVALVRCLRESGDLSLAVESGEAVLAELTEAGLAGGDQAVELAVTLVSVYYRRGDVAHAIRACSEAIRLVERGGSSQAQASVYWNASIVESKRGSVQEAISMAERALALLQTSDGPERRNLARLRKQVGVMYLRLDPPQLDTAEDYLDQAEQDFDWTSASAIDLARHKLGRAELQILRGSFEDARAICRRIHDEARRQAPMLAADAKALEGLSHAAVGDVDAALREYSAAVALLTGLGADTDAGALWFELGGLLDEIDQPTLARDAYRSAAAALGSVRPRPVARQAMPTGV